ncbi:unnamed protein product [Alopecurus aequalis]
MDQPNKQQPTAAKPTSTLLDAYEVECIRRELESLLLNQSAGEGGAACSSRGLEAEAGILGLRLRHRRHSCTKKANRAPAPPTKKLSGGGTLLHLGRHAAKICSGAVSPAGANGRRPWRTGYREVEKA